MGRSKTKIAAAALAAAMAEEYGARDDIQQKKITVKTGGGTYTFVFAEHDFPDADGDDEYDIDIDIVGRKKSVEILGRTMKGFTFAVMSKGVHYVPQPINCIVDPTECHIQVTYTDGLNEDEE